MHRLRSVAIAVAALAVTAGLAAAHVLPAVSDSGLLHARDVSGQAVPVGPAASPNAQPSNEPQASGPPSDTHGATVSAAARSPTPSGFANHGAYVSSIAHKNDAASNHTPPPAADNGLANRP